MSDDSLQSWAIFWKKVPINWPLIRIKPMFLYTLGLFPDIALFIIVFASHKFP